MEYLDFEFAIDHMRGAEYRVSALELTTAPLVALKPSVNLPITNGENACRISGPLCRI